MHSYDVSAITTKISVSTHDKNTVHVLSEFTTLCEFQVVNEYMYQHGLTTWTWVGGGYDGADITWAQSGVTADPQMFEGGVIATQLYMTGKKLEMKADLDSALTSHGRLYNVGPNSARRALCQEF